MRRPSRRLSRLLGFTVVPVSLVATGLFVTASSYSVFNATTSNTGNAWNTGSVHLSDDDGSNGGTGAAMFTASNIQPGSAGSRCIVVSTTAGDLPAKVGLYSNTSTFNTVTNSSAAFAGYLGLSVDMGSSTSTFTNSLSSTGTPTCTLTGSTNIYSGTLSGFNTARTNYSTATTTPANVWQTAGGATAETKVYRFSWNFPNGSAATDNAYQGKATNIDFTWESQTF